MSAFRLLRQAPLNTEGLTLTTGLRYDCSKSANNRTRRYSTMPFSDSAQKQPIPDPLRLAVTLRLFAGLRDGIGQETVMLELPSPCTALELKQLFAKQYPQVASLTLASRVARNLQFLPDEAPINLPESSIPDERPTKAIIDLIPPVSGG